MDFQELKAFTLLARHLHFAKAAAAFHSSPSALSRILGRLEEEMGTQLVDRSSRQVRLTEAGERFLEFAQDTLQRKDSLHLLPGTADGALNGTLRVYASVTACYSILPPLADTLRRLHPQLKLTVETGDPAEAETILREGRVDLALAALGTHSPPGMDTFSVRRTPLVFAASKDGSYGDLDLLRLPEDPLGARRIWTESLGSHPLILPARGLARERLDRWLREHRVHPRVTAETTGNEAVLALARLGLGLGLVPRIVLENSPFAQGLTIYPAGEELGDYDIGFLIPQGVKGEKLRLNHALKVALEQAFPR